MTVIGDFQAGVLSPSIVSTLSTSQQYFPRVLGTNGPNGGQSTAPSATSAAGQLAIPGNSELNGQNFSVLIGGSVVAGAADSSTNVTIILRANVGTVASPTYTTIASTGAVALNPIADGVAENFFMKVDLFGTTASGIVSGTQTSTLSTTRVAAGALTADLSSINFGSAVPFGLVVGVLFSVAQTAAPNVASLNQFQLVQL
jgi:hypothetical protein